MLVTDKSVVVPGEIIYMGMNYLPSNGTYREHDNIIASRLGLVDIDGRLIRIIPLSGRYMPRNGDVIIGEVIDISLNGWRVEINSAYTAMLPISSASAGYIRRGDDLTKYFVIGDYLVSKIFNVTSQNLVDLTMKGPGLRKLKGGRIVRVAPSKVPRIIGKGGSMVDLITKETRCNIIVGQNGWVWIQGDPRSEVVAVETLRKVEEESHTSGLTFRVQKFLTEEMSKLSAK